MSTDPAMRASDADRDAVAERLRDAHAEGRLDVAEFQERLDATYAARTHGDLVPLTRDLPAPTAQRARPPARARAEGSPDWRGPAWGAWGAVTFLNVAVWGLVGVARGFDAPYFWPIWVFGPWGLLLVAGTIFGSRSRPERPGRRDGEVDHR